MTTLTGKNRDIAIVLAGLFVVGAFLFRHLPALDPPEYFNFADQRTLFGIPNAFDVLSNVGFFLVGAFWYVALKKYRPHFLNVYALILVWVCIFTSIGSAYFHWQPTPDRLFWDRLPMSVGFSTLVGLLLADRVHRDWGWRATVALAPLAAFSVIGFAGEWITLRPYIFLQFGSLAFLLVLSAIRRDGVIRNQTLWLAMLFYALAKVGEKWDAAIFNALGFVSGHTLKHLLAAVSLYLLLTYVRQSKIK